MNLKDKIKKKFYLLLVLVAFFSPAGLRSQSESWKSADWQVGAGSTYLFDDYLSPISYNSLSLRFSTESFRPIGEFSSLDEGKWFNQNSLVLLPAYATTRSGSNIYHIQADFRNTTFYRFYKSPVWNLYTGGSIALRGGGRLVRQTRNNPGSADIMTDIGVSFMAGYRFTLWGKTMNARYLCNLAIAGLAFSPEYAQSYYEIFYLGNYSNTVKFTSFLNKKHWLQQVSLDIPLSAKKSSLRLSYWNEGRMSHMNNIETRVFSDQFTIGYIKYFKVL